MLERSRAADALLHSPGRLLKRLGYQPVALTKNDDDKLLVKGEVGGEKRTFFVDTGWGMTTLMRNRTRLKTLGKLGVELDDSLLGRLSDTNIVVMEKLVLGDATFLNQPAVRESCEWISCVCNSTQCWG